MKKYLKFIFCFLLAQLSFLGVVVREGYAQAQARSYSTLYGTISVEPVSILMFKLLYDWYICYILWLGIKKIRAKENKSRLMLSLLWLFYILFGLMAAWILLCVSSISWDLIKGKIVIELLWGIMEIVFPLLIFLFLFLAIWGIKKLSRRENKGWIVKTTLGLLYVICSIPVIGPLGIIIMSIIKRL